MTAPNDVPVEAQQEIAKAIDTALAKPQQAQGFLNNIPNINLGEAKGKVTGALDTVLGAIDTIQQYNWILGKYADPIQKFEDALRKVRGWLN
jgi:hypothetical protein